MWAQVFLQLLLYSVMVQQALAAPSFSSTKLFSSVVLDGEVTVACLDPDLGESEFSIFRCRAERLEPDPLPFFEGPAGIAADFVTFTVRHEDGTVVERSFPYEGAKSRSREPINLWLATVKQVPLLKHGINRLEYVLRLDGREMDRGTFEVRVKPGEDRTCRNRLPLRSDELGDCRSSQKACELYFSHERYCR